MEHTEYNTFLVDTIKKIIGYMRVSCQVNIYEEANVSGKTLVVSIFAPDNVRFLIGKDGRNLQALEQIVRTVLYRKYPDAPRGLVVDINDYRKSRAIQATELARQVAMRVRNSKKSEALHPMTPHERRVIHMELATYPDIATESIGEDPSRRVVIKPFP